MPEPQLLILLRINQGDLERAVVNSECQFFGV